MQGLYKIYGRKMLGVLEQLRRDQGSTVGRVKGDRVRKKKTKKTNKNKKPYISLRKHGESHSQNHFSVKTGNLGSQVSFNFYMKHFD